jgi:hypothetical protein
MYQKSPDESFDSDSSAKAVKRHKKRLSKEERE